MDKVLETNAKDKNESVFDGPLGIIFNRCTRRKHLMKLMNIMTSKYKIADRFYKYLKSKKMHKNILALLLYNYYGKSPANLNVSCEPRVICVFDGVINFGGLADRLRGILSVYYIAKQKGIPFGIYFYKPFPLEDFLIPNIYDWRVGKDELCTERDKFNIVLTHGIEFLSFKQEYYYLKKRIKRSNKQTHIYTSFTFAYRCDFKNLFNELFIPSPRLQKSIDEQKLLIGSKYISVSCRFLNLLDDSIDPYIHSEQLSENERLALFLKINETIRSLHSKYPTMRILINSDSKTFLKQYCNVDYAYVIPGNITHIDYENTEYTYEKYEKTFLDFFMIANAELVFLIKSDNMYKSGYPYAASRVYGKKFEIIQI